MFSNRFKEIDIYIKMNEYQEFIDEKCKVASENVKELANYSYISNGLYFEYFVGYEIAALLGYKSPKDTVSNNVSKCNQLVFRDYPGVKVPELDPRTILISRDGAVEILLKTKKYISPDVLHILESFGIDTTNRKCLTKEQQTLSALTNVFKTEKFEDQFKVGNYYLDLYFPEYKIVIECYENGHTDRKPYDERVRMDYVNEALGLTDYNWIRYNPDEKNFDISKVMGQIYIKIGLQKQNLEIENSESRLNELIEENNKIRTIYHPEITSLPAPELYKHPSEKSVNQYTLDGKFVKTYKSITIASQETEITDTNISTVCTGNSNQKTAGKYLWRYNTGDTNDIKPFFHESIKAVAQYSLEGDLIKIYKSIAFASRELDIFQGRAEISKACNGILASSNNFMWRFVNGDDVIEKIDPYRIQVKGKKEQVIEMYKDGILIDSFYNVYEASNKTNKSRSLINRCISGKLVDRTGYTWVNKNLISS
jgi:very-short-patch-repair endonuclease